MAEKKDKGDSKINENLQAREKAYAQALAILNDMIQKKDYLSAYKAFEKIKYTLEQEKNLPEETKTKYEESLKLRGYRLTSKTPENGDKDLANYRKKTLDYIEKDSKPSGLEKTLTSAITFLSLGAIIAGMFLGYWNVTGNVVSEDSGRFMGAGMSLFLLGLLGVWIANRGK